MAYIELPEIIDAINDLNDEIFHSEFGEDTDNFATFQISLTTNGSIYIVEFMGILLWDSENDDRHYFEENDAYEPILDHLRSQINHYVNIIKRLHL